MRATVIGIPASKTLYNLSSPTKQHRVSSYNFLYFALSHCACDLQLPRLDITVMETLLANKQTNLFNIKSWAGVNAFSNKYVPSMATVFNTFEDVIERRHGPQGVNKQWLTLLVSPPDWLFWAQHVPVLWVSMCSCVSGDHTFATGVLCHTEAGSQGNDGDCIFFQTAKAVKVIQVDFRGRETEFCWYGHNRPSSERTN